MGLSCLCSESIGHHSYSGTSLVLPLCRQLRGKPVSHLLSLEAHLTFPNSKLSLLANDFQMLEAAASGILLPLNCGSGPHISDLKVIWNVNIARRVLELIKATLCSPRPTSLQLTLYINSKPGRSTGVCTNP